MKNEIKIKLNRDLLGFKAGRELTLETDERGVVLDKVWRGRLRDAEIDGAVSVVSTQLAGDGKIADDADLNLSETDDDAFTA